MDDISVIIRVRNEERWIGHAIQSVLDHIDQPEIIIIDNNSTDESVSIVRQFQHDPELKNDNKGTYTDIIIDNILDYSPGSAINTGVKHATRQFVMLLSSHCVLKHFPKDQIIAKLNDFVCVFGNQSPIYNGKRITKRYLWSHFGAEEIENMMSDMEQRPFLHNALAVYRKQALIEFPMDEKLVGKEDRYWAKSVLSAGKNYLYYPAFQADHHYTENGNTWKGIG